MSIAGNCVAVPFPAVRHITCWLDRPQPAPGWGRFNDGLYFLVVFDDQNHKLIFQNSYSPNSSANSMTR